MRRLFAVAVLAVGLGPTRVGAQPSTVTVVSSNATRAAVQQLVPDFEKATGHHVTLSFANSADLRARIDKGEAFDVAILTSTLVDDLIAKDMLRASTRVDIARAGVGIAIRKGAARPDVSTADGLKRALVSAASVSYVAQGATASIVRNLFERFGIAAEMQAKTRLVLYAAEAVAGGEAELGLTQISEILPVAGAELAGPLPQELQVYTLFSSAVAARSTQSAAATRFLAFLTTPAAAAVFVSKGMEPPTPTKAASGQRATRPEGRMPPIPVDAMSSAQRDAVEAFKAARGNADLSGPFHPLLRSPELMTRTRALGDYLRFKSALPPRLSEFVILLTAREWTQQYEWSVHYPIALKAGVDARVAQAIGEGRRPEALSDDEALLYDFCLELQRTKAIGDRTYARALARFGEAGVIDTIGLVGYYSMLAMVLNGTNAPLPAGVAPPLPPLPAAR